MPELPEVQTVVNGLNKYLVNRQVTGVTILDKKISSQLKKIIGQRITKVWRRAKMIVIELNCDKKLVCHLKMTGQLVCTSSRGGARGGGHPIVAKNFQLDEVNSHTRAWLQLTKGVKLLFHDTRRFGYWRLIDQRSWEKIDQHHGLEPLDNKFTFDKFTKSLAKKNKSKIKQVLLDQTIVVGLGNIYVDEVLFASKILPTRTVGSLSAKELNQLFLIIPKILNQAIILGGTSFNTYVNAQGERGSFVRKLKVYGRKNMPCKKCGQLLILTKIAGRSTVYCSNCQR